VTLLGVSIPLPSFMTLTSPGSNPVFGATGYTGGEFTFAVQGESKASYGIFTSSDLLNWSPVATNEGIASTRFVTFPSLEDHGFVKVQRLPRPVFDFGIAAKGTINLNGNNFSADSFDSSPYSTNNTAGKYDVTKRDDNAEVGSLVAIINSVSVGNLQIFGNLFVGSNGTVSLETIGSVGSFGWHNSASVGIEPGHLQTDLVLDFPGVVVPFASGGYQTSDNGTATVGGVSYTSTFTGGYYKISSISLSGTKKMLVSGIVSIWLPGDLSMSGNGQIVIAPGASLKIYSGSSISVAGNGILNQGDAISCLLYGLPSCTSITLGGNFGFTGCIYAPSADLTISSSSAYDFVGASITSTVMINGNFSFHYDQNLRRGPMR